MWSTGDGSAKTSKPVHTHLSNRGVQHVVSRNDTLIENVNRHQGACWQGVPVRPKLCRPSYKVRSSWVRHVGMPLVEDDAAGFLQRDAGISKQTHAHNIRRARARVLSLVLSECIAAVGDDVDCRGQAGGGERRERADTQGDCERAMSVPLVREWLPVHSTRAHYACLFPAAALARRRRLFARHCLATTRPTTLRTSTACATWRCTSRRRRSVQRSAAPPPAGL